MLGRLLATLALLAADAARAEPPADLCPADPLATSPPCFDADGHVEGVEVVFGYAKDTIRPESRATLDALADFLARRPEAELIEVRSHELRSCEHCGRKLSDARARAVVRYLLARGIAPERLVAKGYGDTMPLYPAWSRLGRAHNARTELVVVRWRDRPAAPPAPIRRAVDLSTAIEPTVAPNDDATCAATSLCREEGFCRFVDGRCRAARDADCRASDACRVEGLCGVQGGYCRATPQGCRRAELCAREGRCGRVDGLCLPTRALDCRRSEACRTDERCELRDYLCVQPDLPRSR